LAPVKDIAISKAKNVPALIGIERIMHGLNPLYKAAAPSSAITFLNAYIIFLYFGFLRLSV
jgi:hypothetical protein